MQISKFHHDVADKKHEIKHGKYTVSEEVLITLLDKHHLPRIALEHRQVVTHPQHCHITHFDRLAGFKDAEHFHRSFRWPHLIVFRTHSLTAIQLLPQT
jgi:DNA polymerase I-like protein with 3'-5' exonuclease and polymerase domains